MKHFCLLLVVFVSFNVIASQEVKYAPTSEQCRADQRVWLAKLEQVAPVDGVSDVRFEQLRRWKNELRECEEADPEFQQRYFNTLAEISATELARFLDFLHRHNLWNQFLTEDAQGKR